MALKTLKPVTASSRSTVLVNHKKNVTVSKPARNLTSSLKSKAGRSGGKISVRHQGGGVKRRYRMVDFKRTLRGVNGTVRTVEYDPNRNAYISLVVYENGQKAYILNPENLKLGMTITAGENAPIEIGNSLPLNKIPVGTPIHNIEVNPGSGGVLVRSAGMSATLMGFDEEGRAQIKLPSKEVRLINANSYATVGVLSNSDHKNKKLGKAGRSRWMGIRPSVRGMVMPPSDHPHGGGEAKGVIGHVAKDPWGNIKGKKTRRKRNRFTQFILVNRTGQKVKQK